MELSKTEENSWNISSIESHDVWFGNVGGSKQKDVRIEHLHSFQRWNCKNRGQLYLFEIKMWKTIKPCSTWSIDIALPMIFNRRKAETTIWDLNMIQLCWYRAERTWVFQKVSRSVLWNEINSAQKWSTSREERWWFMSITSWWVRAEENQFFRDLLQRSPLDYVWQK